MKNKKVDDSSKHFINRACPYFPCHQTDDPDSFNCLFCYCPLYALGDSCGGSFKYTKKGIKDCSDCFLPHSKAGYDYVTGNFQRIVALIQANKD